MTAYIEGSGNRPDFVSEGVAEEAALGVSVAEDWMETVRNPSDFITRRYEVGVDVFILQVRFLNPKLHVRLVLEKWAWHITGNSLQVYNHESE